MDTDPCNVVNCSVSTIDISQGSINLLGDSYKMASPRFFREDGIYQNKRLCQYNVPSCPIGTIAHMQWLSDNFQLEPMQNFNENASFCLDYVRLFNLDITGRGVPLDFNNNVCGTRNDFSIRISGLSLRVNIFNVVAYLATHLNPPPTFLPSFDSLPTSIFIPLFWGK